MPFLQMFQKISKGNKTKVLLKYAFVCVYIYTFKLKILTLSPPLSFSNKCGWTAELT